MSYPLLKLLLEENPTIKHMRQQRALANRQKQAELAQKQREELKQLERAAKRAEKKTLQKVDTGPIARIIENAVMQSIPDINPIDLIVPKLRKLGVPEFGMMKLMDSAAKDHLNSKSFYDYVKSAFDMYIEANLDNNENPPVANPWK